LIAFAPLQLTMHTRAFFEGTSIATVGIRNDLFDHQNLLLVDKVDFPPWYWILLKVASTEGVSLETHDSLSISGPIRICALFKGILPLALIVMIIDSLDTMATW
jgi:hypothetical protein